MSPDTAVVAALAVPAVGALLIGLAGRVANLREAVTLVTAAALFAVVLSLVVGWFEGDRADVVLLEMIPGLSLRLTTEPLGLLFALVASTLWIVNSIYSIGYMRGNAEHNQTRYYIFFALALTSTMGVALSGNMLTLFVFYELLTLSTYPLVTHHGTPEAMRSARTYMGVLLATSIGLLLFGMIWTWQAAGTLTFTPGGILDGRIYQPLTGILLAL
ncbi:MAG: proton-conducting transporter transmembrane domain-containing protein, partial [Alphaproteobacteria bacterium]